MAEADAPQLYISPKAHMLGQAQQFAIGLATYLA